MDVDVSGVAGDVELKGNKPIVWEGDRLGLQLEVHGAGLVVGVASGALPGVLGRHCGGDGHRLPSCRSHRKSVRLGHFQLWTYTRI